MNLMYQSAANELPQHCPLPLAPDVPPGRGDLEAFHRCAALVVPLVHPVRLDVRFAHGRREPHGDLLRPVPPLGLVEPANTKKKRVKD